MSDENPRTLGTPAKPIMVKCTSLGQPSNSSAYLSAVTVDGMQLCLGFSFDQLRLFSAQAAKAIAGWPVADIEPPAA